MASDSDDSDYEDEIASKPVRKSRQPRSKRQTNKVAAPATSSSSSSSRENMRERLEAFYGSCDDDLVEAIKLRAQWSNSNFSLLPDQSEPLPEIETLDINEHSLSPLESTPNGNSPRGHTCVVDKAVLQPQESLNNGVSSILNVGQCITCMDWKCDMLAVGVAETEDRPIDMSSSTNFRRGRSSSFIYDTSNMMSDGAQLLGSIYSDQDKGAILCLKWRPNSSDIAVLSGNGQVSIIHFDKSRTETQVSLKPLVTNELGEATKLVWRTSSCLIVGFNEGWVAEFDFNQEDWMSPSFVLKAHSSLISALTTGFPNHPSVIFSSCVDGWSAVHDINDLRRVQRPPRVRLFSGVSAYIPLIQSFVTLEDADTSKLVILRQPSQSQAVSTLTRHEGVITAVASSCQHPLVASGAQDGTLHIANSLRRTMITRRQKEGIQDLWMWQLECSHKSAEYRFVVHNEVTTLKHKRLPPNLEVYPQSVCITDLQWQKSWLATGTGAGLIRFDNICA